MNDDIRKLEKYYPEDHPFTDFILNGGYTTEIQSYIQRHWRSSFPIDIEFFMWDEIANKRAEIPEWIEKFEAKLAELTAKKEKKPRFNVYAFLTEEKLNEFIEQTEKELAELHEKLKNPPKPEKPKEESQNAPHRPATIRKRERERKKASEGFRPGDIRRMNHNTFQLEGELGYFLGNLERNMLAIALTGDSGAGKSTFSYKLAKLFRKIFSGLDNDKRNDSSRPPPERVPFSPFSAKYQTF